MATVRHKKPENWLASVSDKGNGLSEERALSASEQASEALLMGLRLREGVDLAALSQRFGFDAADLVNRAKADFYTGKGLVWQGRGLIGVTDAGMPLLDGLLGELVAAGLVSA